MLVELYIEALLVDEDLADQVWELWNAGIVNDDLALCLWAAIVVSGSRKGKIGLNVIGTNSKSHYLHSLGFVPSCFARIRTFRRYKCRGMPYEQEDRRLPLSQPEGPAAWASDLLPRYRR